MWIARYDIGLDAVFQSEASAEEVAEWLDMPFFMQPKISDSPLPGIPFLPSDPVKR